MHHVTQWLQALGEAASNDPKEIRQLATQYRVEEALIQAALSGDEQTLAEALGARDTVVAFLVPSREDEEKEDTDAPSDPPPPPEEEQTDTARKAGRFAAGGA